MPNSGDATLQTLPQSTISSASFQNIPNKNEEENISNAERSKNVDPECKESQYESSQNQTQREQSERNKSNGQENARTEEEAKEDSGEEGRDIKAINEII